MDRRLVPCVALLCLAACVASPSAPGFPTPAVTGEWSGTFESSWGTLPMKASLRNQHATPSISGEFTIDGERASGTVSGFLETKDRYAGTMFWGTLTISYRTASGEMCRSESVFATTGGMASEKTVDVFTDGFPKGNCPDLPTNVHVILRR